MNALPFVDFVESVLRVRLTPAQRVLARVAFDGVNPEALDEGERELAEKLLGPVDSFPLEARLVLAIVKGARIGGSYIFGGLYSLWRALTADLSTLAPGETAVALIVAPDLRLARQVLNYAAGAADNESTIARLVRVSTKDSFSLVRPDGHQVSIECLPATRGGSAVRGRSLVSAILSEAAFFRDESAAVNDLDVFRAVMPRVMPGGLTVLESTPWSEAGLLYDLFSRNFGTPISAMAAHCPTLIMRGDERTAAIVAAETDRDPDNAEREFGAQFILGGSGLFFGPELLRPALDPNGWVQTACPDGAVMGIGGDIGLVTDASAWAAVATEGERLTVCDFLERRPKKGVPLKLSDVIREGCQFAERYRTRTIHVDHHELHAGREHLPEGYHLEPVRGGGDERTERFLRVREAFRQERIRIPQPLSRLTNQLSLIISKPKPGGGTTIVLPRRSGTHLDLASAFILAIDAVIKPPNSGECFHVLSSRSDGYGRRGRRGPLGPQGLWSDE